MSTRFGKWIAGKFSFKLFLTLFVLSMGFAAYETDSALCQLTGRAHFYGAVYIFFAFIAILIVTKEKEMVKWHHPVYTKILRFLSCFLIYDLLALSVWEMLCRILRISAQWKATGVFCVAGISALAVLIGFLHTKTIRVKRYDIDIGRRIVPYRIALISDIHLGIFVGEAHIAKIVRKINELSPDIVVIAGDLFDVDRAFLNRTKELQHISGLLRRIQAREGVYAVAGNHDPSPSDKAFAHFLRASNITLLDDESRRLSRMVLVGRTDGAHRARKPYADVIGQAETDLPIVVLDHDPQGIRESARSGASLVLCGHTHRGQLFPITVLTRWANGKKRFYGHVQYGRTHGIITSGAGFFELPVRIGTDNEIVDLHLRV